MDAVADADVADVLALLARWDRLIVRESARIARRWGLDIEDVRSEVLLLALRFSHRYDPARGAFSTWLGRIVRTVACREAARYRRRVRAIHVSRVRDPDGEEFDLLAQVPDRDGPDIADELDREDLRRRVRSAVAALPARERQAVRAYFHDGLSIRQAGAEAFADGLERLRGELQDLRI